MIDVKGEPTDGVAGDDYDEHFDHLENVNQNQQQMLLNPSHVLTVLLLLSICNSLATRAIELVSIRTEISFR